MAIDVSLISLFATPDKYHDMPISVIGVSNIAFEHNSLYLSKEHWANFVWKNSIWITPNYEAIGKTKKELSKFNGQYVLVKGVFDKNNYGHLGLFSGAIDNVTGFRPWPPESLKKTHKAG